MMFPLIISRRCVFGRWKIEIGSINILRYKFTQNVSDTAIGLRIMNIEGDLAQKVFKSLG